MEEMIKALVHRALCKGHSLSFPQTLSPCLSHVNNVRKSLRGIFLSSGHLKSHVIVIYKYLLIAYYVPTSALGRIHAVCLPAFFLSAYKLRLNETCSFERSAPAISQPPSHFSSRLCGDPWFHPHPGPAAFPERLCLPSFQALSPSEFLFLSLWDVSSGLLCLLKQ